MRARSISVLVFLAVSVILSQNVLAQDEPGCKDHPMFTRMPGFYIDECESKEFDSVKFAVSEDREITVEGRKTYISYVAKDDITPPSEVQILRNYANAIKKIGGMVQYQTSYDAYLKISKDSSEIWAVVRTHSGDSYTITIVEKQAMVQEVTASDMLEALNKDGFIALYINFDTGKATIKPDSKPIIEQITRLLKDNPSLNVSIEGHTDSTGTPAKNKTLSQERALSVINALTASGIDKKRLSAIGWGQEKPLADNRTEEGRAKNRRVEIVKK